MEKQYSGSCNDAIITAYVPVYSAALLSLLPTLSGRKQLFVSNIIISVCMRTLSFWLCLFLLFPLLHAQDAELKMYQDELARALRLKNRYCSCLLSFRGILCLSPVGQYPVLL